MGWRARLARWEASLAGVVFRFFRTQYRVATNGRLFRVQRRAWWTLGRWTHTSWALHVSHASARLELDRLKTKAPRWLDAGPAPVVDQTARPYGRREKPDPPAPPAPWRDHGTHG